MSKTCGDFGGLGSKGLCGLGAGWGTDHSGSGQCKHHDEAASASMQASKESFLEEYAKGTTAFTSAATAAGVDQSTIWRWRQSDPEFDAACDAVRPIAANVRLSMIEDATFKRILKGDSPAALVMFFMVNLAIQAKRPEQWRHLQQIIHSATTGGDLDTAVESWASVVSAVNGRGAK